MELKVRDNFIEFVKERDGDVYPWMLDLLDDIGREMEGRPGTETGTIRRGIGLIDEYLTLPDPGEKRLESKQTNIEGRERQKAAGLRKYRIQFWSGEKIVEHDVESVVFKDGFVRFDRKNQSESYLMRESIKRIQRIG